MRIKHEDIPFDIQTSVSGMYREKRQRTSGIACDILHYYIGAAHTQFLQFFFLRIFFFLLLFLVIHFLFVRLFVFLYNSRNCYYLLLLRLLSHFVTLQHPVRCSVYYAYMEYTIVARIVYICLIVKNTKTKLYVACNLYQAQMSYRLL